MQKALESIASQTFRDFECIIVDDGSTDNSLEFVQNFVDELKIADRRLKILSQENAGVAVARNRGVTASMGEYVCFLDADDWWEPEFLEELTKLIAEYPDAGLYATNYIYYKPGKTHVALRVGTGYLNYPKAYLRDLSMPITSSTVCIPRKIFDLMSGFPLGIKLGEDFLLWAKIALRYPVAFRSRPLAFYNNDLPASHRATRNLYEPKYHMLFNLQPIEAEIEKQVESGKCKEEREVEWKALLDMLRVNGLMEYWLSKDYHDVAEKELEKVDWTRLPRRVKAQYEKPIWLLKTKRRFMQTGSYIKQKLIKQICK